MYQTIATVPGEPYVISFWYAQQPPPQNNPNNELEVIFADGSTQTAQTLFQAIDDPVHPWAFGEETFTAISDSSTIVFGGKNGPGWFALDDIDVDPATPEPDTAILGGIGLGLLVAAGKRFRRQTATR
jgi:hypothetical protein